MNTDEVEFMGTHCLSDMPRIRAVHPTTRKQEKLPRKAEEVPMFKKFGLTTLMALASVVFVYPTQASAQDWHDRGDRGYHYSDDRRFNGHRDRDWDRDRRQDWREDRRENWRQQEWREHERWENRYDRNYYSSPGYSYYGYYGDQYSH